jgi:hypothetical protein
MYGIASARQYHSGDAVTRSGVAHPVERDTGDVVVAEGEHHLLRHLLAALQLMDVGELAGEKPDAQSFRGGLHRLGKALPEMVLRDGHGAPAGHQ